MILCERCGRMIPSSEVFFRVEVAGRRRMFCGDCGKAAIEEQKATAPPQEPKAVAAAKPAAAKPAAAPTAAGAAAKPKLSPEELEARKKAALEKAKAAKAAREAKQGEQAAV